MEEPTKISDTETPIKNSEIKNSEEERYINLMDDTTKKAYLIAKKHLGSSFNLGKSIGFKQYMKKEEFMKKKG